MIKVHPETGRANLLIGRHAHDIEGMEPDGDLPPFVTPDHLISARVDGSEFVDQKMKALAAHATQVEQDGPFFSGGESGHAFWGEECYRIVRGTPAPGDDGYETDLFAGL